MELKRGMVLTGLSALSYLGYSSFSPPKIQVAMARGINTTKYKEKYNVFTMSAELLKYKVKTSMGIRHFSLERLFVEFSRFKTESTIKGEIFRNLKPALIPEEVVKVYKEIKSKTRKHNFDHVKEYLEYNYINIVKLILDNPLKAHDYIREYFLSLIGDNNIPTLLKGGSAVELFIDKKRSTNDIDILSGDDTASKIIHLLTNSRIPLYVKLTKNDYKIINEKTIAKLSLKLFSTNRTLNNFLKANDYKKHTELQITFNKSLSDEELKEVINAYGLTKRPLKLLKNKNVMVFSKEMLLSEKYHAIIIKPKDTKRSKDLYDLNQIGIENLNWQKLYKWLFKRFKKNLKNPLNKNEALKWIENNKNIPLEKIKANWDETLEMYEDTNISFATAIKVYNKMSEKILQDNKNGTQL